MASAPKKSGNHYVVVARRKVVVLSTGTEVYTILQEIVTGTDSQAYVVDLACVLIAEIGAKHHAIGDEIADHKHQHAEQSGVLEA